MKVEPTDGGGLYLTMTPADRDLLAAMARSVPPRPSWARVLIIQSMWLCIWALPALCLWSVGVDAAQAMRWCLLVWVLVGVPMHVLAVLGLLHERSIRRDLATIAHAVGGEL